MRIALAGKPEYSLFQPPGIIIAAVDSQTGLLVNSVQPGAITEYFLGNKLFNNKA